ncbi:MAG TPA: orotidine-5'-phosphate decarboxylase [Aliidongia sp.]|uniref:orotidine-5'-phosphate decarboxylase n=1 Tax=Aliidongia sp. TaxID=1914230 RepID=UPI002DDCA38C|nr:orotidine-5'-phosphate decarboxylase [Aliidongia sp.]HEV2677249.1 orotidine-5'-phosphate decarboxylase [Aliidongia sp.]
MNPVFVALDTTDLARARHLAGLVAPHVGGLKLGLEFFLAQGLANTAAVAGTTPLFLDLKLHDIPNTVAGGVRAIAALKPEFLTVHAAGGPAMLRAAVAAAAEAADQTGHRVRLLGVTVLTSLDDGDLDAVGQRGPAADQVRRLALLARASGLDGVICSPFEVAGLRAELGPDFQLVVPGIRPAGAALGDQKRVMGPRDAIDAGASRLVIGRPITDAPDPAAAARAIAAELAA